MLFGVQQIHSDRTLAHAGPVAESMVGQAKALFFVQRNLQTAQFPDGHTPDVEAPGTADRNWQLLVTAVILPAPQTCFLAVAFRIQSLMRELGEGRGCPPLRSLQRTERPSAMGLQSAAQPTIVTAHDIERIACPRIQDRKHFGCDRHDSRFA